MYHKPATPFVYQFLGDVNLFHVRYEEGSMVVSERNGVSGNGHVENASLGYARPHRIDLSTQENGGGSIAARIVHINAAGPLVKLELESFGGDLLHVWISQERYHELELKRQDTVYVKPRDVRIFEPEYVI